MTSDVQRGLVAFDDATTHVVAVSVALDEVPRVGTFASAPHRRNDGVAAGGFEVWAPRRAGNQGQSGQEKRFHAGSDTRGSEKFQ